MSIQTVITDEKYTHNIAVTSYEFVTYPETVIARKILAAVKASEGKVLRIRADYPDPQKCDPNDYDWDSLDFTVESVNEALEFPLVSKQEFINGYYEVL
jgi:hypothetical protein